MIARVDTDDALREWYAVFVAVAPRPHASMQEFGRRLATNPERVSFVARVAGETLGAATAKPSDDVVEVWLGVLPHARRRGIGTALLEQATEHGRSLGKRAVQAIARENVPEAIAFFEARGFEEHGRGDAYALDVTAAVEPDPPAGVALVTLADRAELARAVYELAADAGPMAGPSDQPPFEVWRERYVTAPEAVFVAVEGDDVVGVAWLDPLEHGEADHGLTMVREDRRGRGIAQALKRAQISWAYANGFHRLTTSNADANAAMRAVNEKLGYRPLPAEITFRKALT